ncbi:MAG: preprotein translocase subunit SecE [Bdellovibrionales bacterium]|nr:preprotein translocase subunit SecE [Bdellovibrionales bacterium]
MANDRKWIVLSFIGLSMLVAWVLHQAGALALSIARTPNPMVLEVLPASAVISIFVTSLAGFFYFRRPVVQEYSMEVLQELRKVTWPMKKMTYASTIVVLVACVLFAGILGVLDWASNWVVTFLLSL